MPIRHDATRWNSTFESIERAILLKERLEMFCYRYNAEIGDDELTADNWKQLQSIRDAPCPPLETFTKKLSINSC